MEFNQTVVESGAWRREPPPSFRDTLLSVSVGVVGAIVLLYAVYRFVETTGFMLTAVEAEGRVVEVFAAPMQSHTEAHPGRGVLAEFKDVHGGRQTCLIDTTAAYDEGDLIPLLYPPGQPDLARRKGFWPLYGTTTLLFAISLPFAFFLVLSGAAVRSGRGKGFRLRAGFGDAADDAFDDVLPDVPLRPGSFEMTGRSESYEFSDPETGEVLRYDSFDALPRELLHQLEQLRDDMREVMNDAEAAATYSWTDESGRAHSSHSLEDVPPDIREMFEELARRRNSRSPA